MRLTVFPVPLWRLKLTFFFEALIPFSNRSPNLFCGAVAGWMTLNSLPVQLRDFLTIYMY
jgi:hypothetical protein